MNGKKAKIIGIVITIAIVLAITIFVLILSYKNASRMDNNINYLEISNIEDIKNKVKEINPDDEKTASKYMFIKKYKLSKKGMMGEKEGKYIYLRESLEDINIFKTEYDVSDANQVEETMQKFTSMCKKHLSLEENEIPVSSYIVGEINSEEPVTVADCIYKYKLLSTDTYEIQDEGKEENKKTYEINFYMDGEKLVCELAYLVK